MKRLFLIFCITLLIAGWQAQAQNFGWVRQTIGGSGIDQRSVSMAVDKQGNVFTVGSFRGTSDFDPGTGSLLLTPAGLNDVFISKLDAQGNLLWAKKIGGTGTDYGESIALDAAGNCYITGWFGGTMDFDPDTGVFNLTAGGTNEIYVVKLSRAGQFVWAKQFKGHDFSRGYGITVDITGNVYITGYFSSTVDFDPGPDTLNMSTMNGNLDAFIVKLNNSGNLAWAKHFAGGSSINGDFGAVIRVDASGNIYTLGIFNGSIDFDPGPGTHLPDDNAGTFLSKLDASGNMVWTHTWTTGTFQNAIAEDRDHGLAIDASGDLYMTGTCGYSIDFNPGPGVDSIVLNGNKPAAFIAKIKPSGDLVWVKYTTGPEWERGTDIAVDHQKNVYVTGSFQKKVDFDPGVDTFYLTATQAFGSPLGFDIFVAKLDSSGNFKWAYNAGSRTDDMGKAIMCDRTSNIYVTGDFTQVVDFDPGLDSALLLTSGAFVTKLLSRMPYAVTGNVFADVNVDCTADSASIPLPEILVRATPGPNYALTDATGNYIIFLPDSGSYNVTTVLRDSIWQAACSTSHTVQFSGVADTIGGKDFALRSNAYCPRLTVDISASRTRPCFNATYYIDYKNTGTLQAQNAYVEVDFGANFVPQSSTLPWSTSSGNEYTFPLGDLHIAQKGKFAVSVAVNCAVQIGSAECVTAHIYPDTLCEPAPAGWDKSQTTVRARCNNDSLVCFTIKNRSAAGGGDMNGVAPWRLYVDDTLRASGNYQLAGGDSLLKCYPANGRTYRMEADQNPPHPGNSRPRAIIEACGNPFNSVGFVNTAPQDDADLSTEIFCSEVTASFDPNDKLVSPAGITSNKYITKEDELQYMIRFQNTGTDTAFKVVIIDTIDTGVLDIVSLSSGASSHDYTFNISGTGIAEWTFDNILLPDSNVNEAGSHGFVQFKIKQLPGNTNGTLIENRAAIYFDFNEPVITNYAWNEVNEVLFPEALLAAGISNHTDVLCFADSNGTSSAQASGGLSPYSYAWNNGSADDTVRYLVSGNYSVTVTDAAGATVIDSVTILQPQPLTLSMVVTEPVTCFGGDDAQLDANINGGTAPYTYDWNNPGPFIVFPAGEYSLTITDANGCVATDSVIIAEGYAISVGGIAGVDTADIRQAATYSIDTGLSYTWTVINGVITAGQGTNSIEVDWSAAGQGTVFVEVDDQGCIETVGKTVALVDPTGVHDVALNQLEVYPNPTSGLITVKASNAKGTASIKLYYPVGKETLYQTVAASALQQGVAISMDALNQGTYFLHITTATGMRVMKVVKN